MYQREYFFPYAFFLILIFNYLILDRISSPRWIEIFVAISPMYTQTIQSRILSVFMSVSKNMTSITATLKYSFMISSLATKGSSNGSYVFR